jgi:hypothetical protein
MYLQCLKESSQQHNKCREFSKRYLECRMEKELMAKENLEDLGYSEDAKVINAKEYDKSKEKQGYVAGKHIDKSTMKWWWDK